MGRIIDPDALFEAECHQLSGISALEEYLYLAEQKDTERGYTPITVDMLDRVVACQDPGFWESVDSAYYGTWQKQSFIKSLRSYLITRQRLSPLQDMYARKYYLAYMKYQLQFDNSAEVYMRKLYKNK